MTTALITIINKVVPRYRREVHMSMNSKWHGMESSNYTIVDLGRPAVFLLPLEPLKAHAYEEAELHAFLMDNFESYTAATIPSFGFWKNKNEAIIFDECREYEVSFVGKDKIPMLMEKLASIAKRIGEDCVYFKAGQYGCVIYPK